MKPIVLIRSGGDIASGAIYRLWRAGYRVVVNEIAIPTMIRREVSYGNAVHRGEMILERLRSRHLTLSEVPSLLETREAIPVVTEPYETVLATLEPTIETQYRDNEERCSLGHWLWSWICSGQRCTCGGRNYAWTYLGTLHLRRKCLGEYGYTGQCRRVYP